MLRTPVRVADIHDELLAQCLYGPECWFFDIIDHVDIHTVRTRTDTTRLGPFVDAQRVRPNHPKHVPGAVMVQLTGSLGLLHAVYGLNLVGHVGFGTHIRTAKFPGIGRIGPELLAEAQVTRVRRLRGRVFVDYAFHFTQSDGVGEPVIIYQSEQSAIWMPAEE